MLPESGVTAVIKVLSFETHFGLELNECAAYLGLHHQWSQTRALRCIDSPSKQH